MTMTYFEFFVRNLRARRRFRALAPLRDWLNR